MPGKKITDHQVLKYKEQRNRLTQVAAAAKAGISERSARRVERSDTLPSQGPARSWRTRPDPLADVWDAEVVPLLHADAQLNAVTLLEELQRRHPGQYGASMLRTLQRRLRQWRCQWAPKFPQMWAPKIPYAGGSGRSVISHIRDRIFLSSVVGHGVWAAADGTWHRCARFRAQARRAHAFGSWSLRSG